ncbi:hypothetical protein LCGC14_2941340 [marine sediment metagenome]|uniref:Uncharacterized protein n=1 Tax=marine sediment metagenome TaxID=412755 RepID=A0A0F8XIG5_9ZZZZ
MALLDQLHRRVKQVKERRDQAHEVADRQRAFQQQIQQQVKLSRDLLADPRFIAFRQMITEVANLTREQMEDRQTNLRALDPEEPGLLAARTARLQGRLDICMILLEMPEAILSLAEQGRASGGNGHRPQERDADA